MAEDNGELRLQLSTILSELTSLKREVHGTNQNVATEVKKLKTEKDLRWKFQGNKSQYDFNCDIVDTLKQAEWAIENHKLEHCSDQLKEALDKLHTRNKHIRIADTSAGGWETVRQYESNPIASNSEDESKIFKAENRALKKKKSSHTRSSTSVSAAGTYTSSTPVIPSLGVGFPQSFGRGSFFFRGQHSQTSSYGNIGGFGAAPGPCFACGEYSHYRRNCPYARPTGCATDQPAAQHTSK